METDGSKYQLSASQVLWECLQRCWHDNVFLTPLCHRFWKLTLQLLSRYAVWVDEVYNTEVRGVIETMDLKLAVK